MTTVQPREQPWYHLVTGPQPAVLVVPGSLLFTLDEDAFAALDRGEPDALAELRSYTPPARVESGELPPVTALSLNVAQACNQTRNGSMAPHASCRRASHSAASIR